MLNLIQCEIMKLKRSKIIPISIMGVMSTPLLMLAASVQTHFQHPEKVFTLAEIYSDSILYTMLISNVMIFIAIAAYLFSREYTENTFKTILPIPVSRLNLICAKFAVLFAWTFILTIITWIGIFILSGVYHITFHLEGYTLSEALRWLPKFILGNVLVFLTVSPFAYIAARTKGFVAPVIASAVVVMGSAAVSNQNVGALYPWTSSFLIVEGRIQATGFSILTAALIIGAVFIAGSLATFVHFKNEDIK